MKKNLGNIDKIIRVLIALVVAVLFFTDIVSGTLGIVLLAVSGVLVATSFMNFCPLYAVLGINSCPVKK